jgi:hypothetical protein
MWPLIIQRLAFEFIFDVLLFPVWWYTQGLKRVTMVCGRMVEEANMSLAPGIWLKNIFVPMYGQYDWQGRLMSIFMRIVNIIGRGFAFFLFIFFVFGLVLIWIFFPLFVIYFLLLSLFG